MSLYDRTPPSVNAILFMLLLLYLQSSATEACGNSTLTQCQNGGVCMEDGTCECPSGYTGRVCETTVMNVAILALVSILPLISWGIICGYGWRSYRARVRRRRRRRDRARSRACASDEESTPPVDDDPPGYYQAVYENPMAAGQGGDPDWTSPPNDYLEPPPHYDDLINAIKLAEGSPIPEIIQMEPADAGECSRVVGDSGERRRLSNEAQPNCTLTEDSDLPERIRPIRMSNGDSEISRSNAPNPSLDQGTPDDEPPSVTTHTRPANEERISPRQEESVDNHSLQISSETASGTGAEIAQSKTSTKPK